MVAPKKNLIDRRKSSGGASGDAADRPANIEGVRGASVSGQRSLSSKLRRVFQVPGQLPKAPVPGLGTPLSNAVEPEESAESSAESLAENTSGNTSGNTAGSTAGSRGGLRAFLQQRRERIASGLHASPSREKVSLPDADILQTEFGPLWRRELRYRGSHKHGNVPLDAARHFDRGLLAKMAKSPSFAELSAGECLFLDTETTGLSGGAGTVVFGYGLAFFEGDELVLEQLFLRDFGEEAAMLQHVKKRLIEHPVPVTFVGKSYDRHRIAARLAVHKISAPVLTDRHLDLYHVIRRQFGGQWPNSKLHTAEERLLGLYRDDDLPGSEAPAAFLDWIRDETGPVDRVMEHNRLDVLSLVALLGVVTSS